MYEISFDKMFSALNYKYTQVPSSVKSFSNSFFSSRCTEKEYPPIRYRIGWGTHPNWSLETICLETTIFKLEFWLIFLSFSIYLEIWPKMKACQENDRNPKHTSLSFMSKHYFSKAYPENWFQQHKTLVGDKWAATCISQHFKSIFWYHVYQCSIQIAKMSVSFNVIMWRKHSYFVWWLGEKKTEETVKKLSSI